MQQISYFSAPSAFYWVSKSIAKTVIGAALVSSFAVTSAYSQAFTLAPTRLIFEGQSRAQELTIVNGSNRVQTYRVRVEDRTIDAAGEFQVVTDPNAPFIASTMLRLSARQFVVQPQESATVRVLLRKPSGLAAGEYRSHLVVTELPSVAEPTIDQTNADGISIKITPVFGISIPILVRTGETSIRLNVSDVVRTPVPDAPDYDTITMKLNTVGNRSMFVDMRIVDPRRRRSEPIFVNKGIAIYAPTNARNLSLSLTADQTARVRAGGTILVYQEVNKDGNPIGPVVEVPF